MSKLNFPNDPASVGNIYVGDNGVTYHYSNGKWTGSVTSGNGGNANTGIWYWDNNTAGTPANIDLQIQTIATGTQHAYSFWVSEYGGLGANALNSLAFGVGAVYDSQGNLYILGAAEPESGSADSLLLKYDPLGNLIWHKTWHDPSGSNCGATNVALAIDSTDRIYWVANDWFTGGCWFGYMDTDGNIGLGGTAQEVLGFGLLYPTDLSCDDEHAYISGVWNNIYPIVIKVNGNTGNVVWASTVLPQDSANTNTTGIYRAVTIDPTNGNVWAIGDYLDTAAGAGYAMLTSWNPTGTDQDTRKLVTYPSDRGEAVVYNNGYIYTVVNDSGESKTVVSKFNALTWNLIWASNLAAGIVGYNNGGYDLSFDAVGNVYLTGTLPYPSSNANIWVTKLNPATGAMIYSRVLATSQGSVMFDGTGAPLSGHRVGDIYENRIAVTAMTTGDLVQGGSFQPRIVVSQLPLDGSISGTFSNIVIYDATGDLFSHCSTGTYSLTTLPWEMGNQTGISTLSQLSPSNVTVISTMTNKTITLAAGPVIGFVTATNTWQFGITGNIILPEGGAIAAKDNGAVTIKAGNETAYWWSEYGDLLLDNRDDWGSSVEYDSHGNVYIVGGTYHNVGNNNSNIQALLVKYSPTGQLLWQKAMFDQADIYIRGEGLWIDSADNLFMIVQNDDNNWSYLLKLDTEGNIVWQVQIDPSPENYVHIIDIDGDNQGHVYIVGVQNYVNNDGRSEPWVACYATTDGTCIWQQHVDITGALSWSPSAYGIAVGVNPLPAVYITGQAYISNQWQNFLVSMSAIDGTLNWSNQLLRNDGWYSEGNDVAVDAYGAVYVVGQNSNGLEISKWSSVGSLAWAKVIDKYGNSSGNSLDFDRDGYLYITGYNGNAGDTGNNVWLVIKMDQTGAIIWQNALGSQINNTDQWYYDGHKEIAVSSDRNALVITGYTYVGTTATVHESLYNSNILTVQFPLDGTMTGNYGPFQYTPTTLVIADSNVTSSIISTTITSSAYAMSTATIATISNDEAADTHHLTGDTWQFTTNGHIILPPNGDIIDGASGKSVLGALTNAPHVARLDNAGVLVDQNGRSVTGELNRRTDTGNNFNNLTIAIRNASGYKRLVGVNTSPQTWLDLTDVANQIGINRYWITGMVLEYQAQSSSMDYNGSMVGQIIIASNENYEMTVSHTESAITRSNSVTDVVFSNLDIWRIDGGTLQAARADNRTGQQLDIIWTAKVFFNASEDYC